jgi:hypothetical protein
MDTLKLPDYLSAARTASDRARNVTIVLTVASVVMLVGMLNSLYHSWAARRLLECANPDSSYVTDNIGPAPNPALARYQQHPKLYLEERARFEERYRDLNAELTKSYVETAFGVRVPLFGIFLDINDLGALGGFGLLIILFMFDYSVRQETENLKVGFERALADKELESFYDLLAMYQLLTVPLRKHKQSRAASAALPKAICVLPILVQLSVVGHDVYTNPTGEALDALHNTILLVCEMTWLFLMVPLTYWTTRRLCEVDRIWDQWALVRFRPREVAATA